MCGAFGFAPFKGSVNIALRYHLSNKPEVKASYNIRPTMKALTVTRNSPNMGAFKSFGIKAPWNEKQLLINAKSETVGKLKTFKGMFEKTRCLVPASHFFEWQKTEDRKIPYAISVKDKKAFSFAGIFRDDAFVILTTNPNSLMKPIHNRMPVVLTEKEENMWLDPETPTGKLEEFFEPFPSSKMEAWEVSDLVNSARNQTKDVISPTENQ